MTQPAQHASHSVEWKQSPGSNNESFYLLRTKLGPNIKASNQTRQISHKWMSTVNERKIKMYECIRMICS